MKKIMINLLLTFPLILFVYIWIVFVFEININVGFIPEFIGVLMIFFGTPLLFLVGSIYTFYKKNWYWFGIYMLLGGFPVATYFILSIIHSYF
ncbi:hypothetical protein [Vibrio spartinae]|uniref:Uncharacterized protein n=1 Tax=Vibrio spartinae TaxID=1918945 RepID=A0A1N6LZY4_9VIBR|nr:hypothetical protein [Vibrio spartinae]SIO92691.1 hypothetical protein VSP9026_00309 [Vibrio spartinae]